MKKERFLMKEGHFCNKKTSDLNKKKDFNTISNLEFTEVF